MAYTITLPNYPVVNQLTTQTTDSRPSENASLDCGMACCASLVQYLAGVTFLPDEVKDIIWQETNRTPETAGATSASDLTGFLQKRAGIQTTMQPVTTQGEAMHVIRSYLFQGLPLLVLRSFSAPNTRPWHWCVVTGAQGPDDTHTTYLTYMNPWGGRMETQSNVDFFAWMADDYPAAGQSLLIGVDTCRNPWLP